MELKVCTSIPADVGAQWNALVVRMERPEVFHTHEWALATSRAFTGTIPLLLMAYEGEALCGVAALATDGLQQGAFFLTGATADYCDFVSHPSLRAEFLRLVLGELRKRGLSLFVAANVPADSATTGVFQQAAGECGYGLFARPAYQCAQVVLRSADERQTVKQALLTDKKIRYHLKSLAKQGPVSFDHLTSPGELQSALPGFFDMHIARFRASGRNSNLMNRERQVFLAELAQLLSPSRHIVLSCLKVGDHTVAWNYGFQFAGSWFYYQPTFDFAWQRYSPGVCLLAKIVEAACARPDIQLVDLGLGNEGYKNRFSTGALQTLHLTVTSSAVRRWREVARYNAASVIKSSPFLEQCVRRVIGRASRGVPA